MIFIVLYHFKMSVWSKKRRRGAAEGGLSPAETLVNPRSVRLFPGDNRCCPGRQREGQFRVEPQGGCRGLLGKFKGAADKGVTLCVLTLRKDWDEEEDEDGDRTETCPGATLTFALSDNHLFNFWSVRAVFKGVRGLGQPERGQQHEEQGVTVLDNSYWTDSLCCWECCTAL